ncbi:Os07g0143800, partial [Oryza sativa Japonica Group]
MIGIPKANVFPVPVLARPIISLPCIAGSRTALWMGKSLVMPRAASLSTIHGEIPSLATSSPSSPPTAAPAS